MTSHPNSLAGRDIASVIHPYTNLEQHKIVGPTVIAKGEGVYVYDDSGKRYLEGMAGLWSTSLGFSEKRLVEAAREQLAVNTARVLDVTADVLSAALYTRFRSRRDHTFAEKILSAMRKGFGAHVEPKSESKAKRS